MVEFGENGSVKNAGTQLPSYSTLGKVKLKRVGLASFLCGVAACILVTLIGIVSIFTFTQITSVLGWQSGSMFTPGTFWMGVSMATILSALNWYIGYITIPVAWLVLGLSLGRFPRRQIIRPAPYYRWGAIWGAILVSGTASITVTIMNGTIGWAVLGAFLTGAAIGTLAGLACGGLFLAIVRPAEQAPQIEVDVF